MAVPRPASPSFHGALFAELLAPELPLLSPVLPRVAPVEATDMGPKGCVVGGGVATVAAVAAAALALRCFRAYALLLRSTARAYLSDKDRQGEVGTEEKGI